jgi:hemolysin D
MRVSISSRAWVELLGRYWGVLRTSWRQRSAEAPRRLGLEEIEFLPPVLSLQTRVVSPTARMTAMLIGLLILSALLWSVFGHIDVIVNSSGKLIPNSRVKAVGSVEIASVHKLFVEEGQHVKAGEVLVELDTRMHDADRDRALNDALVAKLQAARAKAMLAAIDVGRRPVLVRLDGVNDEALASAQRYLDGQYDDFMAKLRRIDADVARYQAELPLARQKESDYRELLAHQDVSPHAYFETKQALIDVDAQLDAARKQRTELITETKKSMFDQLADGEKSAVALGFDAQKAASQGGLLRLSAPIAGVVQQLNVHTVGGVVPAAQTLLTIVPENAPVEVEASVENKDIGFIRPGLPVAVKVETFDYTKYGTVPGHVSDISPDAVQDEKRGLIYTIHVALDRPWLMVDGKKTVLSPGMSIDAEIRTGDRRVIDYVLSPLLQHAHESFHER